MRRQEFRWLLSLFTASSIAVACAGEEHDSKFDPEGNGGGKGGSASTSKGGSSSTGGKGGSASTSKGGSGGGAGTSTAGSAGAGGSTAGTGGSSAGTGGATQPDVGDCDVGGAGFGDDALRVEFKASSVQVNEQPGGTATIVNDSGSAIAESEFSLRYYFTSEFPCDEAAQTVVHVYDFRRQEPHDDSPGLADVVTDVVVVGENGGGCDVYVEFVVTIDLAAAQYATLNFGTSPPNDDYNSHPSDQSNDTSFGACTTLGVPWSTTPLYVNDVLTWGDEPDTGAGGAGGGNAGGAGGNAGGAGGAAAGAGGA